MCAGMCTRCPAPGTRVRSTFAAGSAFSGVGEASIVWMYSWHAIGWSGTIASTASMVAWISGVSGRGSPSGDHRSHGRRFMAASAKSAPTSASFGYCFQTLRMASLYATSSALRSSWTGHA